MYKLGLLLLTPWYCLLTLLQVYMSIIMKFFFHFHSVKLISVYAYFGHCYLY